jgi:hypothetical protein
MHLDESDGPSGGFFCRADLWAGSKVSAGAHPNSQSNSDRDNLQPSQVGLDSAAATELPSAATGKPS